MKRAIAAVLLLGLALAGQASSSPASAGLIGEPLQHRFLPEDYNAAPVHLAIAADPQGRMLFGNVEGLLRYDGENWELIDLPGHAAARAVATGKDGRTYVGSYDSFGWLDTDAIGITRYRELLTAAGLKGEQRNVGTVWSVLAGDDGVYFRADRELIFLDYEHRHARVWPLSEDTRTFQLVDGKLYTRIQGQGYGRFEDGRFLLEPGGERFADAPLPAVLPLEGARLLVGFDGFYRADAQGVKPWPEGAPPWPKGVQPYTAQRLPDGSLVLGTRGGELLCFGPDLRLRQRLSLGRYSVEALGSDREGGLWAATEGGLVRLSLPSPWSFIGGERGLHGNVYDFEWHQGALWLAGSSGVSRLDAKPGADIEHKDWVDYEAFALLSTREGLLIGHRDGLQWLPPGAESPRPLIQQGDASVFALVASRHDPGRVYALSDANLHLLAARDGRWVVQASLPLEGISASGLEEGDAGEVWIGDSRGGPHRWRLDLEAGKRVSETVYGAAEGIELDPHAGSTVFRLDDVIHVVSGQAGYRFDGREFQPDVAPPFTLVDRPAELAVRETPLGTYAYTSRQLWHRAPGASQWQAIYLNPDLAAGYGNLRFNQDGVLRVTTWRGLLQYDPRQPQRPLPPLSLKVESVSARPSDGSRPATALPVESGRPVEVPAGYTLNLRFSMVSMESGAQYRYLLHGVTPDWSDWTDRDLFIRSLPAGDYVLDVQARTRSGREVPTLAFRFHTQPRWYEQWWVWLLGATSVLALALALTQAFIRRRTERFQAANRRLEARIAERTRELEDVNRQLAELATEDALTGIANRRALEHGLRREWLRCLDQRRTLSALMIDVDHFKKYNDDFGHLEGDLRLKTLAQHLRQRHDPQRELLARYGGEEFCLLLPGVPLDEAHRRAEELRAGIAHSSLSMTVSIGVAGFVPDIQSEPDSLLRRADAALYRAKRGGRNRVETDAD